MEADEKTAEATPKKRSRKKLFFLVVLPLVLVLLAGGGGTAAYLTGVLPTGALAAVIGTGDPALEPEPAVEPSEIVFVNLPELLVNLELSGRRLRFLKFTAALEVVGEDAAEVVRRFVPRVTDNIHVYLRSLHAEELGGAEAVYRIKKDLLARINQVVEPAEVREVLVKEMLVQ